MFFIINTFILNLLKKMTSIKDKFISLNQKFNNLVE